MTFRPNGRSAPSVNAAKYKEMYQRSISDPEGFWAEHGKRIDWFKPYARVKNTSFDAHNVSIKWFEDGVTNVAHNCIDRHLPKRASQTAIIWEGDDPSKSKHITYAELADRVGRFANVLKGRGVKKGDRVTIYLPMIPEAAYAMLACARIGAIHSVVFGGFSPDALAGRIADAKSEVVITADEGLRGGRKVPLKANVDAAIEKAGGVKTVIVVRHTGGDVGWRHGRDVWLDEAEQTVTADCPAEPMNAEDPLFILYTSGSTGAPKGVVHTTGGYLVYVSMTHQYVFDYHEGDIYWCTADVGWVTGHSYILYGPLANGATTLMFEGIPNYPSLSRFWEVIDKHKVNIFYTAPTAIRSLMGAGEEPVEENQPRLAASSGFGRRADQSGGVGMVLPRRRRQPLPGRRHLVADRDRRHPHFPVARRDEAQGRVGDQPVLWRHSRDRRRGRQCSRGRMRGQPGHRQFVARPVAHRLRRPRAIRQHLFRRLSRQVLHRRRRAPRRGRLLLDHRAASTTSSMWRATAWERRKSRAPSSPIRKCRRPRSSAIRTTSRGRASTPM